MSKNMEKYSCLLGILLLIVKFLIALEHKLFLKAKLFSGIWLGLRTMFNAAVYTGTGIVAVGLGAAYYAYATRAQLVDPIQLEEIDREHEISAREDAIFMGQYPGAILQTDFEDIQQEAGDLANNIQELSIAPRTNNETFEQQNSHSSPAMNSPRPLRATETLLRTSLHSLNSENRANEGLNISPDTRRTPLINRKCESLAEIRHIVSRTEVAPQSPSDTTSPTSAKKVRRPLTSTTKGKPSPVNKSRIPRLTHVNRRNVDARIRGNIFNVAIIEQDETLLEQDDTDLGMGNERYSTSKDDSSSSSNLHQNESPLNLDEMFATPSTSENILQESLSSAIIPLRKTSSPVVYYTNPRFGDRFACKNAEYLTREAILENSNKQLNDNFQVEEDLDSIDLKEIQLKSCSTTEKFQQILREKRAHLRPVAVGLRKSEGMIPEPYTFPADSDLEEDSPGRAVLDDEDYKDSTLFLFPPVLSESRISDFAAYSRERNRSRPRTATVCLERIAEVDEEEDAIQDRSENLVDMVAIHAYNLQLEQDMANAEVSSDESDQAFLPGPVGASMFDLIDDKDDEQPCAENDVRIDKRTYSAQFHGQEENFDEPLEISHTSAIDDDPTTMVPASCSEVSPEVSPYSEASVTENVITRPMFRLSLESWLSYVSTTAEPWITPLRRYVQRDLTSWEIIYLLPFIVAIAGCFLSLVATLLRIVVSLFTRRT